MVTGVNRSVSNMLKYVYILVSEEASLHLLPGAQDQRLGAEQDQLPCWPTGNPSGTCQKKETRMVRICWPRQPLQNHPSGHCEGWATPWSAEQLLGGHRQRVDIPAQARIAAVASRSKDLKRISAESSLIFPQPLMAPTGFGTELY